MPQSQQQDNLSIACRSTISSLSYPEAKVESTICGAGRIDLGTAGRFCCASLKHGPAATLDFLVSAGQIGETFAHFLRTTDLVTRHVLVVTSWPVQP